MGATANAIYRKLDELSNGIIELRTMLIDLEIADSTIEGQEQLPRTGWRWVKGDTSGTYVRDPNGIDKLPPGYDLSVYHHPNRKRDGLPGFGEGSQSADERATVTPT